MRLASCRSVSVMKLQYLLLFRSAGLGSAGVHNAVAIWVRTLLMEQAMSNKCFFNNPAVLDQVVGVFECKGISTEICPAQSNIAGCKGSRLGCARL